MSSGTQPVPRHGQRNCQWPATIPIHCPRRAVRTSAGAATHPAGSARDRFHGAADAQL